jgi:predicted RNA binding protein YcfA (HicA-like mRNA interferase family)
VNIKNGTIKINGVIGVIFLYSSINRGYYNPMSWTGGMLKSSELISVLIADGWKEVRCKGSHHQFKHPTKQGTITVPHPKKDLGVGLTKKILKDAGL